MVNVTMETAGSLDDGVAGPRFMDVCILSTLLGKKYHSSIICKWYTNCLWMCQKSHWEIQGHFGLTLQSNENDH